LTPSVCVLLVLDLLDFHYTPKCAFNSEIYQNWFVNYKYGITRLLNGLYVASCTWMHCWNINKSHREGYFFMFTQRSCILRTLLTIVH